MKGKNTSSPLLIQSTGLLARNPTFLDTSLFIKQDKELLDGTSWINFLLKHILKLLLRGGGGRRRSFWNLSICSCSSLHKRVPRFSFGMTRVMSRVWTYLNRRNLCSNLSSADKPPKTVNTQIWLYKNLTFE